MTTVVNGDLPVPPSGMAPPSPGKRKRDPTPAEMRETNNETQLDEKAKEERLAEGLKDLLQVLSAHDSDLGILRHPLPGREASEPHAKRTKLSGSSKGTKTIESRILSHEYKSLQALVKDVEVASDSIVAQRHKYATSIGSSQDQKLFHAEFVNRARQFKRQLNSLLCRPPFKDFEQESSETSEAQIKEENSEPQNIARGDKAMLTLWTSVGRGRYLFSSLQKSPAGVESIEQASLPENVTISKAIPYHPLNHEPKTPTRTLGEVFPPRSSLPNLEPPRRTELSAKRSPVVEWLTPVDSVADFAAKLEERKSYSALPIPLIQWTTYGYDLPGYPVRREKYPSLMHVPKQQSRSNQPEGSLFREMFSSFAPSFDSTRSGSSRRAKSRVWWNRSGTRHMYRYLLSSSPDIESITTQFPEMTLDPEGLEDAVNSFNPEPMPPAEIKEGKETSKDEDPDSLLQQVSELLQTLDSFRQLRQLGPGTSSVQDADGSFIAEVRSTPSALELETYETLKSSLSAMIATLPPHFVAKLNGEQLAAINVSKNIVLDNVDYPGTMEEDEYTVHQRQAAKASQMVNPRVTNPTRTPPAVPYQQRYPPRAKPPPGNYHVPQPYGNRTPGMHYQPNGISHHATPLQSAAHHQGYAQQPQYSQPGTPQPFPATGSSILQQFQRSGHNGNSPHVGQRGMSPAQPLPQHYQQRPIPQNYQHPHTYRASVPGPRSASPPKPTGYIQSPQRPYMSPSPNPHQQQRYFQQPQQHTPQHAPNSGSQPAQYANFPSNQASPVAPQYSNAAAALAYSRSAAEQAALMERNRAQLAEAHRQGSSTPQPVSVHHALPNGQPVAQSQAPGTPGSIQNATQ